ncbi:hypothetical protein [Vibrio mimicus]|uniref:hypothetical protein n=1 Tax=Vibrio mimicus TaxID=674 RepID=UPI002FF339FC
MTIRIKRGWDLASSLLIAELYEEAFGLKFCRAIPDKNKRINVLSKSFVPDYSFAAFFDKNWLVWLVWLVLKLRLAL